MTRFSNILFLVWSEENHLIFSNASISLLPVTKFQKMSFLRFLGKYFDRCASDFISALSKIRNSTTFFFSGTVGRLRMISGGAGL